MALKSQKSDTGFLGPLVKVVSTTVLSSLNSFLIYELIYLCFNDCNISVDKIYKLVLM